MLRISGTVAVTAANTAFPLRQPSNIWGQFSVAISEGLPWKQPFSFLPAACLHAGLLKVDPSCCQPWAGLWLQACPIQRLRPCVDLGGLRGQLRSYTVKPPRLDPRSASSTYRLLPCLLLPLQSALPLTALIRSADMFPSQPASRVICCYLSLCVPFSTFFPSRPVDSHRITAACHRTGSHCERSASIRAPIIISNQSHFSN